MSRPSITFGALDLHDPESSSESYSFEVLGENMTLGTPAPVDVAVNTLMQDGSKVVTTGHDNREVSFFVVVTGSDTDALAAGETALFLECAKPNTLTYEPFDGYGAATQFDVWTSSLEPTFNDMLELGRLQRAYKLTLTCAPFGGSVDEITTVGVTSAASPTTVVINDGSSVTGWTVISFDGDTTANPAVAGAGQYAGAVGGDVNPFNPYGDSYYSQGYLIYTPATAVDMSATSFLQVDWACDFYGTTSQIKAFADGIELTLLGEVAVPGKPYIRSTFLCPDGSVGEFRVKGPRKMTSYDGTGGPRNANLYVDQLVRTNQAPSTSTLRQKVTSIDVLGSARTQGSIKVEHASSALGYTIVHTYSDLGDGYTPDLSRWISSGGPGTADSSLVSGYYKALGNITPLTYTVPLRILRPGPYVLVARVRASAAGDYTLGAGGAAAKVNFATANTWQVSTLGVIEVGDHVNGSAFSQTLVTSKAGSGSVDVDEAWLFYVGDDAALTRIQLGTGTPSATGSSNRLWLDTPNTTRPYPSLWRGTLADKSDARNAVSDADAWGDHQAQPPSMTVFTVTTNALDAQVSLTHRPRWHTHARAVA